jgi:hypothetical protein
MPGLLSRLTARLTALLPAALLSLTGCGLGDYLPRGPSLKPSALERWLDQPVEAPAYTGEAAFPLPVPPLQIFALHYTDDIVIETDNPAWSMHEYARVVFNGQSYWIAKDSDRDGVQTVTAGLPDLEAWLPEIPVPRHYGEVAVEDRSQGGRVDVTLRYPSPLGEQVEVSFAADRSERLEPKRSGSTFNHSQQVASVVLDIPHRQLSKVEASVSYDGQPAKVRRVLGLIPVAALLDQTQAGFATASMKLEPSGGGLRVRRPIPGESWPTRGDVTWAWQGDAGGMDGTLSYEGAGSAFRFVFEGGGLAGAEAGPPGEAPSVRLLLGQPLPDLRRPFEGELTRPFALSLNDDQLQGHGWIRCWWEGSEVVVRMEPEAPSWFVERPMETRLRFTDAGAALLRTRRIEPG